MNVVMEMPYWVPLVFFLFLWVGLAIYITYLSSRTNVDSENKENRLCTQVIERKENACKYYEIEDKPDVRITNSHNLLELNQLRDKWKLMKKSR